MLGVTKHTEQVLALFRLSLELARKRQTVPAAYRKHVEDVLAQARQIVDRHSAVTAETLPEAIDLALAMTALDALRRQVEQIDSFEKISPMVATRLLEAMEQPTAYAN